MGKAKFRQKHVDRSCTNAKTCLPKSSIEGIESNSGCPGLCRHRPGRPLLLSTPVWDDFHFLVLAFLQGLSACFYLNSALHMQKIQITIRTMGVMTILPALIKGK